VSDILAYCESVSAHIQYYQAIRSQQFEENTAIRRPHRAQAPTKGGPRSNEDIQVPQVQLIDAEGENRGSVNTEEALQLAQEAGLDLVEISPNNNPPICKILDLGKYKY